jgi:hypothetical protein
MARKSLFAEVALPESEPMNCGAMALAAQPRDDAGTEDARLSKAAAAQAL